MITIFLFLIKRKNFKVHLFLFFQRENVVTIWFSQVKRNIKRLSERLPKRSAELFTKWFHLLSSITTIYKNSFTGWRPKFCGTMRPSPESRHCQISIHPHFLRIEKHQNVCWCCERSVTIEMTPICKITYNQILVSFLGISKNLDPERTHPSNQHLRLSSSTVTSKFYIFKVSKIHIINNEYTTT